MTADGKAWRAKIPEADFIRLFEEMGPSELARRIGSDARTIAARRARIEERQGIKIKAPDERRNTRHGENHPGRIELGIENGVVLIASDCHYWNIEPSTAHRALVKFCKEMKPAAVIMNGDVLDGATISRHPPINWEQRPSLIQEIEACQDRLGEITKAAGKARRIWTLGNHDARFETRLATVAPEYAKVHGTSLKNHFPDYEPCWSVWINDDVVVKHRFRGGLHSTTQNPLWAGKTIICGHLHSLQVRPLTDYRSTRFGVDTGCIADPIGPQFDYAEQNPLNWRSGFVMLTFRDGELMWPEIFHVLREGVVEFRGVLYNV